MPSPTPIAGDEDGRKGPGRPSSRTQEQRESQQQLNSQDYRYHEQARQKQESRDPDSMFSRPHIPSQHPISQVEGRRARMTPSPPPPAPPAATVPTPMSVSGAAAGTHRESFSRTPVQGSQGYSHAIPRSQRSPQSHPQSQPLPQSHAQPAAYVRDESHGPVQTQSQSQPPLQPPFSTLPSSTMAGQMRQAFPYHYNTYQPRDSKDNQTGDNSAGGHANAATHYPPAPMHASSAVPRAYGGTTGQRELTYAEDYQPPQIWTAVYSNVSVYETLVNSIAVMRRRADSWLNATQILKVAGVPKAKRTKILQALEREVPNNKHEKVQGGYGKYQGTWIEFDRGLELCREWGVDGALRCLLELGDERGTAGGGDGSGGTRRREPTPTKEEVMALQRKRIYRGLDQPGTGSPVNSAPDASQGSSVHGSQGQTYFQSISNTAASAVNAMNQARFDNPMARDYGQQSQSASQRSSTSQQQPHSQQHYLQHDTAEASRAPTPSHLSSQSQSQSQSMLPPISVPETSGHFRSVNESAAAHERGSEQPPRKRMRTSPFHEDAGASADFAAHPARTPPRVVVEDGADADSRLAVSSTAHARNTSTNMPPPPPVTNKSFPRVSQFDGAPASPPSLRTPATMIASSAAQEQGRPTLPLPPCIKGLPPLQAATTSDRYQKQKLVMTLFLDKKVRDFTDHPAVLTLDAIDLEIPLDEHLNTALHWAAMLARMPLIYALVKKGVSIFRLNAAGETALQKAVGTRNNFDYRSFGKLLGVLAPTIEVADAADRNVLHHICMLAATGGGGHVAARHYLESLLDFVVKHGGRMLSPPSSFSSAAGSRLQSDGSFSGLQSREVITLGRLMATLVNAQDEAGDTPLNIAGRANTRLVPQLLELGANQWIANNSGLRPADYGVGADLVGSARRRGEVGAGGVAHRAVTGDATRQRGGEDDDQGLDAQGVQQKRKTEVQNAAIQEIAGILISSIDEYAKELALKTRDKQAETRRWHDKIRESARQRQIEQKGLEDLNKKHRRRIELERRIRNLENAMGELKGSRKKDGNGGAKLDIDIDLGNNGKGTWKIGDAERSLGIELERFKELFPDGLAAAPALSTTINAQTQQPLPPDPMSIQPQPSTDAQIEGKSHPAITNFTPNDDSSAPMRPTAFTPEQVNYLTSLPSPRSLRRILAAYNSNNDSLDGEIEDLKAKNTALGETYRRIVMACTGWTAKQVDEAAEGLTECVKEINESPVPEEEAIEILMRERGQDW